LPGFVRGVLAVADHFGPAYAGIGHSLGAAALAQAAVRGLRVQRLLLLAPAAEGEAAVERFVDRLGLGSAMAARMIERFEQVQAEPMRSYHVETAAAHLQVPVLVIHDIADREVPGSEGERYALKVPGARMLTVSGLGHHRVVDAPEVRSAGMAFLQGAPVGEHLQAAASLHSRWC
jgi:pimeloyl-ACP methyl ester carboxylesterase